MRIIRRGATVASCFGHVGAHTSCAAQVLCSGASAASNAVSTSSWCRKPSTDVHAWELPLGGPARASAPRLGCSAGHVSQELRVIPRHWQPGYCTGTGLYSQRSSARPQLLLLARELPGGTALHAQPWRQEQHCWRGFAGRAQQAAAAQRQRLQKKSSEQGLYLVALVVGMVGLTYASVPLYRMFCQATGFGGTVQEGRTVEDKLRAREAHRDEALERAAAERELTVSFNADVADGMPWRFLPAQRSVKVRPGQSTLVFYTAHNLSDRAITGVSTYNVAPQQAGFYFNKIQCFCFEEQRLRPGEKIDMPVFFYVDPEFATDARVRSINHLTLSYTFFNVEEEAVQVDGQTVPAAALLDRNKHKPLPASTAHAEVPP